MSSLDKTMYFNFEDNNQKDVRETLETVYDALEKKGYDPINQIVGYLLSGDPAYIPRLNDARNLRLLKNWYVHILIRRRNSGATNGT